MTPSAMGTTSNFEKLPDELLIAIFTPNIEIIPRHYQKHLTPICLVNKGFFRVAHEMLLTRPYVRLEKLDLLRAQYLKYPGMASTVRTIEIVSQRIEKCLCNLDNLLHKDVSQSLCQLESLFILLPHLSTLLLGSNNFLQVIPLQTSFLEPGQFICTVHGVVQLYQYGFLTSLRPPSAITETLGRLRVLELPVGWDTIFRRRSPPPMLDLTACTSLEHLTIPVAALFQKHPNYARYRLTRKFEPFMYKLCPLPQSLVRLTISNNGCVPLPFCDIGVVVGILALRLRPSLPKLTELEIWSRSGDPSLKAPAKSYWRRAETTEEKVILGCASMEAMGIRVVINYESRVSGANLVADLECEESRCQDLRYIEYDGLVCRGYFRDLGIWGRGWQRIRRSQYRSS